MVILTYVSEGFFFFFLERSGVNVRKSAYKSLKKQRALGGAENENNSELGF